MKIERIQPPAPPPEITLTFSFHEGWAVLGALGQWADQHPDAQDVEKWKQWARDLSKELRK